jgi:hypothetical protein
MWRASNLAEARFEALHILLEARFEALHILLEARFEALHILFEGVKLAWDSAMNFRISSLVGLGDRMESDVEDPMDFSKEVTWEDKTPKLREVSEKTKSLLTKACTCRLNNSTRLSHRSSHPLPKVSATRTPQLDPVMKSETSAAVKAVDKELARLQTFVLDALATLTTLLEEEQIEQVR